MCQNAKMTINDQGKEFVNQVAESLHIITGTKQKISSANHPQSNGLCERQNRIIKDSLLKVVKEKAEQWPEVIESVLFAHYVHFSTNYHFFIVQLTSHSTNRHTA